jgi:hypothetical protein
VKIESTISFVQSSLLFFGQFSQNLHSQYFPHTHTHKIYIYVIHEDIYIDKNKYSR